MRYCKRPVVVHAVQFTGGNRDEIAEFLGVPLSSLSPRPVLEIETLSGRTEVNLCDWIIRGVVGEFYPCKPDIFEFTYEEVDKIAPPLW